MADVWYKPKPSNDIVQGNAVTRAGTTQFSVVIADLAGRKVNNIPAAGENSILDTRFDDPRYYGGDTED